MESKLIDCMEKLNGISCFDIEYNGKRNFYYIETPVKMNEHCKSHFMPYINISVSVSHDCYVKAVCMNENQYRNISELLSIIDNPLSHKEKGRMYIERRIREGKEN